MDTIQIDLGNGTSIMLPTEKAATALIARLQAPAPVSQQHYVIGEYAQDQGGIFAGVIHGDDGVDYGLIFAPEKDIGKFSWGPEAELDLSQWDGLGNTNRLNKEDHPAAYHAASYERDGHLDFYLPSRREMMIALANVPHLFDPDGWYWTSTPVGDWGAWAVDFEYGNVRCLSRHYEFRVRPVRRFPL